MIKKDETAFSDDEMMRFLHAVDARRCDNSIKQPNLTSDENCRMLWEEFEALADLRLPELEDYDQTCSVPYHCAMPVEKMKTEGIYQDEQRKGRDSVHFFSVFFSRILERIHLAAFQRMGVIGFGSLCTSIIVMVVMLLAVVQYQVSNHHIEVKKGDMVQYQLSDGSLIEAASAAKLSVREDWRVRETTIDNGFAYFDIEPNPSKPFVVKSDDLIISVLGTSFSVYRKGAFTEVVVESGGVNVSATGTRRAGSYTVDLVKNEKLLVTQQGFLEKSKVTDLDRELSWRKGMLYFEEETLANVLSKIRDFYPHPIHMLNSKYRSLKITGSYSTSDITSFIEALQTISDIKVKKEANGAITLF